MRNFSVGDILFAFITGVLIGVAEPPWSWQTYAVAGIFIVIVVVKATKERA